MTGSQAGLFPVPYTVVERDASPQALNDASPRGGRDASGSSPSERIFFLELENSCAFAPDRLPPSDRCL